MFEKQNEATTQNLPSNEKNFLKYPEAFFNIWKKFQEGGIIKNNVRWNGNGSKVELQLHISH